MKALSSQYLEHIKDQNNFTNEELKAFETICQRPLRKSVRLVTNKSSSDQLYEFILKNGWKPSKIPWCNNGFWLEHNNDSDSALGNLIEHLQGRLYIQEASSMLPAEVTCQLLDDTAALILDMAAAPGSKTTQIASALPNSLILANELSSSRVKSLSANVQRCGLSNIAISHHDGRNFGSYAPQLFDAVLLDAPCGGEGTIRKDPQALDNWSIEALTTISNLQKELIDSAYHTTKPGGVIVYSTCTLSNEENQMVCDYLLDSYDDIKPINLNSTFIGTEKCLTSKGYLHVFPHYFDSEGFFVAAFRKGKSESSDKENLKQKVKSHQRFYDNIQRKELVELERFLKDLYNFELNNEFLTWRKRDDTIWLVPNNTDIILNKVKIQRSGVPVAQKIKSGFRITHDFAVAFGCDFKKNTIAISSSEAVEFYKGRDIEKTLPSKNELLLTYNNQPIGLAKAVGSRLKNRLPRYLVRDNAYAIDP